MDDAVRRRTLSDRSLQAQRTTSRSLSDDLSLTEQLHHQVQELEDLDLGVDGDAADADADADAAGAAVGRPSGPSRLSRPTGKSSSSSSSSSASLIAGAGRGQATSTGSASPSPNGRYVTVGAGPGAEPAGGWSCSSNVERFGLVDRAFDDIGAGRYHVALFFTASLGFFVEAAEMNVVSLILAEFAEKWGADEEELSVIPSVTAAGMMIGTLIFGRLSDVWGRKRVYHLSLSMCVFFGFVSSFARSVNAFAATRLLLGIGYGGNMVSSTTLLIESTPTQYRGFFSALTSYSFTLGGLAVVLLSWGAMDAWGWEWVVRATSLVGAPVCVALFFMPGSVYVYNCFGNGFTMPALCCWSPPRNSRGCRWYRTVNSVQ